MSDIETGTTMTDGGIRHDLQAHRFAITIDSVEGHLDYELDDGGAMRITHTIVPPAIGGRGVAGLLVRAALDHARNAGLKVVPRCSYADAWMRRHPAYGDLRA